MRCLAYTQGLLGSHKQLLGSRMANQPDDSAPYYANSIIWLRFCMCMATCDEYSRHVLLELPFQPYRPLVFWTASAHSAHIIS